ncbi:MAG: TniB family NTP-binding protein [Fibrobacter sp.]|nr:TniB family NTP-binding protein [Fibrobacter sp.]
MANFSSMLPQLLLGEDLEKALTCLPQYNREEIKTLSASERLLKLTDIYRIFIPTSMTYEIYQKLYTMVSMSLRQKGNIDSIKQMNANYKWAHGGEFHGVVTGASSSTIIGNSGIGKTSAIQYAIGLLGPILETEKPYHKVIPVLMVSCPFDSNYKGLLCQILISIDEILGTNYYERSEKSHMNAQQVLGMACQLCHLYVGTLIIDEIQFIVEHRAGKQLYLMILQLINTSCISVLLVGTSECIYFFRQAPQIARRSVGLEYGPMDFGNDFKKLCQTLFNYQYVAKDSALTDSLVYWLYEHSGGISASLVSLIHDAQEIAIMKGKEILGIETLTEAYNSRLKMLHGYTTGSITKLQTSTHKDKVESAFATFKQTKSIDVDVSIADIVAKAKRDMADVMTRLREHITIEVIPC